MDQFAPPPSRFIPVGDLDIHVRDEGRGPAVVLLHGMFSSLHTWDGWVIALEDTFRLIRLDLPGFGLTGPSPDHDYSMSRYVRIIDDLMDSLGIDDFAIAGNSLGGAVAWEYSLSHPERITRLILIDAVGYPRKHTPRVLMLGRLPLLRWLFRVITPRCMVLSALEEAYGDDDRITSDLTDRYYRLILREGNRGALLRILKQQMPVGSDRISAIQAPALIMWGAQDEWIPLEHAHRFRQDLPNASLVVYPEAGHAPMEEIPERTALDARQFLLGVSVPDRIRSRSLP
jgi:pimeloyl-ACP methyl ester carboxylesterase